MIKAIFYDFDGVIKESTAIKTQAFYDLYLPFGKVIAEKAMEHHINHGGISRFEKFKHYHSQFLGKDLSEPELNQWAQKFSDLVCQKVIESPYVMGALHSIEKLSKKYDQHIVTGTPQNEIEFIISELNIGPYFKSIQGSPRDKITICDALQHSEKLIHDEIVFIGDATTDYKAAKHHQYHFILREHEENQNIFNALPIIKTPDLSNLENLIEQL